MTSCASIWNLKQKHFLIHFSCLFVTFLSFFFLWNISRIRDIADYLCMCAVCSNFKGVSLNEIGFKENKSMVSLECKIPKTSFYGNFVSIPMFSLETLINMKKMVSKL